MRQGIWEELGIEPTRDLRAIKRAYARCLKVAHPEDDAEGFERLRQAYERARAQAESPLTRAPAHPGDDGESDQDNPDEPGHTAPDIGRRRGTAARFDRPGPSHAGPSEWEVANGLADAILSDEHPVERFRAVFDDDRLIDLAYAQALEVTLASRLAQAEEPNPELLATVDRSYGWSQIAHGLRPQFSALFRRSNRLALALDARAWVSEVAHSKAGRNRPRRDAARMLLGEIPYSPRRRRETCELLDELPGRFGSDYAFFLGMEPDEMPRRKLRSPRIQRIIRRAKFAVYILILTLTYLADAGHLRGNARAIDCLACLAAFMLLVLLAAMRAHGRRSQHR